MDWTGSDIRELRRGLRLSQADLATNLDVSSRSVQNWEAGTARVSAPVRRALDRLRARLDANAPRPLAPRLNEATATELLAEVAARLAAAERALDQALFRGETEPLTGPTSLGGGTDPRGGDHTDEQAAPDAHH